LGLAERLRSAGAHRGDRIATLTANSADHAVMFFACACAGLVLVPLNWRLAPAELAYQLDDCEPVLVATDDERVELADRCAHATDVRPQRVLLGERGIEAAVPRLGVPAEGGAVVADDDPMLLIY